MPEITLLSQETIDKIAAGEVVERPSSVVKELVENAIDAKATAITVEVKEGGISFIRITDNGCGIERAQVPVAFLRHSTSKIKSVEDLMSITSLGFRGEALSSIAAVSQVELITKTYGELTGTRYVIEGSKEKENEEIGAPEIKDFDDLIDVMEQMQKARPTAEDGTPCFGTILNNGSDSSFWACMVLWYRWQGYFEHQLPYLLEADMYNGEYHSILDKDSLYYKGLKWYNKVYRRGLMDPDSINNDRPTQKVKVDGGYAQIPSGYLPGWAPTYLEYHIPGTKVFYAPVTTYGDSRYLIGINANTKNVEACLAYLDMLADPEAYLNIIQGPDGEFWYSDDQGNAYLTEAGTKWFEDGHNDSSGFTLSNGETLEMWNSPFLARNGTLTRFGDGKGGYRTASILGWTEFSEIGTSSKVFDQWRATTGHENWKEWLGDDYSSDSPLQDVFSFTSLPDDNMQLMIDAIKDKVTTASWKMVYSSSDSEFDTLWDQMVADCNGLDANSIIEWRLADLENAKQIRDSL